MLDLDDYRVVFTHIIALIVKYKQTIEYFNIYPDIQLKIREIMPKDCPEQSENFYDILRDLETTIIPSILHWNHSQFHGYVPVGSNYLAMLTEILITGLGINRMNWTKNNLLSRFEYHTTDLLGRLLKLPESVLYEESSHVGGGIVQNSECESIYYCMLAARNKALKALQHTNQAVGIMQNLNKLVCYASQHASYSVLKSAHLLKVKLRLLCTEDTDDSLTGKILEQSIRKDINQGFYPFFVVATIGSFECGSVDQLLEISQIVKKYRHIWYHVSAPYAAPILILPELSSISKGMQNIDSFDCSPSFWCLTTPNCSLLWLKRRREIKNLFCDHQTDDNYTKIVTRSIERKGYDAIKLWFMLKCTGKRELEKRIRNHIVLVKFMEELLKEDNIFVVMNKAYFGVICFTLRPASGYDANKLTSKLLNELNKSGKIYLSGTILRDQFAIKCYLGHEYETKEDIIKSVSLIQSITREFLLKNVDRALTLRNQILNKLREQNLFNLNDPEVCKNYLISDEAISDTTEGEQQCLEKHDIQQNLQHQFEMKHNKIFFE